MLQINRFATCGMQVLECAVEATSPLLILSTSKKTPSNVESITFYSDNCVGQIKNLMFMIAVLNNENIDSIDHKFLITGHTHLDCDADHSLIERKIKAAMSSMHHPRDWLQFIGTVGTGKSFVVVEMNQNNIFNFAKMSKETWRHVDVESILGGMLM